MAKQLPFRPNLEHLKKQARQLLQDHQAGKLNAVLRLRTTLPRCKSLADQAIRNEPFVLRDAQHVIALEYGFENWKPTSSTPTACRKEAILQPSSRWPPIRGRKSIFVTNVLSFAPKSWQKRLRQQLSTPRMSTA